MANPDRTDFDDPDPAKIGYNQYIINYYPVGNAQTSSTGDQPYDASANAGQAFATLMFDQRPDHPGTNGTGGSPGDRHGFPDLQYDANGNSSPADPLIVTYQFQTNAAGDSIKADYLTRNLMSLSLGVRLYEFNSRQPQQISLTQKIKVRNLQR